ncbi:lipoate protein ligase C-terminal domain-containing protein, partial [Mycoplasmopsis bovis]|uniref:lipoate protein ligase C-terminal domain-containing protein n=1 Tax=Mycoplasmopsis bovis TaxID=28903 RepID=UPI003D295C15
RSLFSSEKWIYDRSANFTYSKTEKFTGWLVTVYGTIENSIIKDIIFAGDFLSKKDIRDVETLFKGIRYDEKSVREVLTKIDIENYFGTLTEDEIVK